MIVFDRVSKQYSNGHQALAEVSVEIDRGEMVFLTGRSGAGKSTLLKLIMLMERATTGEVFVAEQNLNTFSKSRIPYLRRQIGVVFQNHQLLFDRTVFDNVALPLKIAGFDWRDIERRVRAALSKVGLENFEKHLPMNLSGGEQQRVGIARAVVNRPKILLADEPTGNLDTKTSVEIMALFEKIHDSGNTIIIVTHEPDIAEHAHRVVRLRDGLVETDTLNETVVKAGER